MSGFQGDVTGEPISAPLKIGFDRRLKLQFHGAKLSSDGGLIIFREFDDALGLTEMAFMISEPIRLAAVSPIRPLERLTMRTPPLAITRSICSFDLLWPRMCRIVGFAINAPTLFKIGVGFVAKPRVISNDAMRVMVEMDVFLLTSRIEGLPNVLIEAQALGVPVVTVPAGGAAETLDHSRTGIVLEGSESEKAAEVIVNLLHDEAWMANARQVAPEFVKQAFCIEKVIDKILAVYDVTENRDECASGNCVVAEEPQRNDD